MIRYEKITPDIKDGTAGYSVKLDKEYTVQSFADMLITERSEEWGNICLVVDIEKPHKFDNPSFWYRNGRIDNPGKYQEIMDQFGAKKISKVEADGGWHRLDYTIWMEEAKIKQVERTPVKTEEPVKEDISSENQDEKKVPPRPYRRNRGNRRKEN